MSEIISLHLGQAGVQIGESLWELFMAEQGLGSCESSNMKGRKTLFSETSTGNWIPRCIFADLDDYPITHLSNKALFRNENLLHSNEDSSYNFARARCLAKVNLIDKVFDRIRKEAENCDNLQGFLISHSIGGGAGSGINSLLLDHLSATYPEIPKINFSVFPSPNLSPVIVEPYNALVSIDELSSNSDACIIFDNQRIFDICLQKLDIDWPAYKNIDDFIAYSISSILGPSISGGSINQNFHEFIANLVPIKSLKFLSASVSPIMNQEQSYRENPSVSQITQQVFEPSFNQANVDLENSKSIACSLAFKGDIVPKDIELAAISAESSSLINGKLKYGFDETLMVSNLGNGFGSFDKSVCLVRNETGVKRVIKEVCKKFDKMDAQHPFLYWFLTEPIENGTFYCAREGLNDIMYSLDACFDESMHDNTDDD